MTHDVWAVCKDPGGTNGILPVVRALRQEGVSVQLIANGRAKTLLATSGEDFLGQEAGEEVLARLGRGEYPKALVTSMCSGGGIGRDLVSLFCGRARCIAVQDFWGGGLWTDWADRRYRPDYICVNDPIGGNIVHRAWPDYRVGGIAITGFPALDKYADLDVAAATEKVRTSFGLDPNVPIVLFAGQLDRTADILAEVIASLGHLGRNVYFFPRLHPRMATETPDELQRCQQSLDALPVGQVIRDSSAVDIPTLVAASTVVLSAFSTVLIEAIMLRKQNIAILYPGVGLEEYRRAFDYRLDFFPPTALGCTALADDRDSLVGALDQGLDQALKLREKQEEHFRLDGMNATRVAKLVRSVL